MVSVALPEPAGLGARAGVPWRDEQGVVPPYCDEKNANREIRVGHLVIENGY